MWVGFPSLPLKLWSKDIISQIASLVGNPLFMDKTAAKAGRIEYARYFVEVNAANKLPQKITVDVEGAESMDIPVEFESVPPIYTGRVCFS